MLRLACNRVAVRHFAGQPRLASSSFPNVFLNLNDNSESSSSCSPTLSTRRIHIPSAAQISDALAATSSSSVLQTSVMPTIGEGVLPDLCGSGIQAATSFEQLALFFSPTQLGIQFWEFMHTATGLPWWISIPVTTLSLKLALLPLSAKARASSANLALIQEAVDQSRIIGSELTAAETRQLGRLALVKKTFRYLKARHQVPSFRWYVANLAVQMPLFLSLTFALRRMSSSLWPGLVDQGVLFCRDLTPPPLYLDTLSTPFGTAGAILPLAIALLYSKSVDLSAAGRSPGVSAALKLALVPGYCAALLQPHAVLFFWAAQAAATAATLKGLLRTPNWLTSAARVPSMILEAPPGLQQPVSAPAPVPAPAPALEDEGKGEVITSSKEDSPSADAKTEAREARLQLEEEDRRQTAVELEALLLHLAADYEASKNPAAAWICYRRLLISDSGHATAAERLAALRAAAAEAEAGSK